MLYFIKIMHPRAHTMAATVLKKRDKRDTVYNADHFVFRSFTNSQLIGM
jgi:hypothetical protein